MTHEKESEPIELTESTEPTTLAEPEPTPAPGVHSENDYPDDREPAPDMDKLPRDLKEIIEILESLGGRMTRKDLGDQVELS